MSKTAHAHRLSSDPESELPQERAERAATCSSSVELRKLVALFGREACKYAVGAQIAACSRTRRVSQRNARQEGGGVAGRALIEDANETESSTCGRKLLPGNVIVCRVNPLLKVFLEWRDVLWFRPDRF